jgi:hypothetical protein
LAKKFLKHPKGRKVFHNTYLSIRNPNISK